MASLLIRIDRPDTFLCDIHNDKCWLFIVLFSLPTYLIDIAFSLIDPPSSSSKLPYPFHDLRQADCPTSRIKRPKLAIKCHTKASSTPFGRSSLKRVQRDVLHHPKRNSRRWSPSSDMLRSTEVQRDTRRLCLILGTIVSSSTFGDITVSFCFHYGAFFPALHQTYSSNAQY